jgi:hypothetical protein
MSESCSCASKRFVSRRDLLFGTGGGISGLALIHLLSQKGLLGRNRLPPRQRNRPASARQVSPRPRPPNLRISNHGPPQSSPCSSAAG